MTRRIRVGVVIGESRVYGHERVALFYAPFCFLLFDAHSSQRQVVAAGLPEAASSTKPSCVSLGESLTSIWHVDSHVGRSAIVCRAQ